MTTDRPEHEPIRVRMADGSVYTLEGDRRLRAFHARYGDEPHEPVLSAFRALVARHWDDRTKPWKGLTVGWGEGPYDRPDEAFADHAELAEPVMYAAIRAPLMAIAMAELADEGDDAPSAIGIGGDRVVGYAGDEMTEHDTLDGHLDDDA